VDLVPKVAVDEALMLAGVARAPVDRLADVDPVAEHPIDVLLVDPVAARRPQAARADFPRQFRAGPDLEEACKDPAHIVGTGIGHQLAVPDIIAERWRATRPHPPGSNMAAG